MIKTSYNDRSVPSFIALSSSHKVPEKQQEIESHLAWHGPLG